MFSKIRKSDMVIETISDSCNTYHGINDSVTRSSFKREIVSFFLGRSSQDSLESGFSNSMHYVEDVSSKQLFSLNTD